MKNSHFGLTIAVIATFSLTGCETFKADLDKGFTDLKTAFSSITLLDAKPTAQHTSTASADQKTAPMDAATGDPTNGTEATVADAAKPDAITLAANRAACPEVRIVDDLNQVHQFEDATAPKDSETISTIRMTNIKDYCSIVKNNVAIDMTVAFDGRLGPKARAKATDKPSFAYPYFVAITNNQGNIIAKEVFAVTMSYDAGKNDETRTEQIRQLIPTGAGNPGSYRVLVGFQLNDQELAYNRSLPAPSLTPEPAQIEPAAGAP